MKAGRELDALVAEKVMGWRNVRIVEAWDNGPDPETGGPRRGWYGGPPDFPKNNTGQIIPLYSTDIAAAWQVVEKMKMTVYAPGAPYAEGEYYNGAFWVAECDSVTPRSPSAEGVADTAPLAICLAALKAVGVEVPS